MLLRLFIGIVCWSALALGPIWADEPSAAVATKLTTKWLTLVAATKSPRPGVASLTPKHPLQNATDLKFTGPSVGHRFLLGRFANDGEWAISEGAVQLSKGTNSALRIARAEELELNGDLEWNELGGWFFLLNWNAGSGTALYNYATKQSGTGCFLCDFKDGQAVPDTNRRLKDYEWKRRHEFTLTIVDGELTLVVGPLTVCKKEKIVAQEGDLLLGVYDTAYGPRKPKLYSLRIRAPEKKKGAKPDAKQPAEALKPLADPPAKP